MLLVVWVEGSEVAEEVNLDAGLFGKGRLALDNLNGDELVAPQITSPNHCTKRGAQG